MSTDAILASIDGALRDYGTSPDAMRWNPALSEARRLAVKGHEYRRRQKARARRKRG